MFRVRRNVTELYSWGFFLQHTLDSTYHCDTSLKDSLIAAARRNMVNKLAMGNSLAGLVRTNRFFGTTALHTKVDPPSFLYAYTSLIPHIWLHNTLFSIVCRKS